MIYGLMSGKETAVLSAITNLQTEMILSVGNGFCNRAAAFDPCAHFILQNSYLIPALFHFFSVIAKNLISVPKFPD